MSEYRSKRKNITSYDHNKKIRLSTSRRDGVNNDLVSVSVDGSHEELENHEGFIFLLAPKDPTVD